MYDDRPSHLLGITPSTAHRIEAAEQLQVKLAALLAEIHEFAPRLLPSEAPASWRSSASEYYGGTLMNLRSSLRVGTDHLERAHADLALRIRAMRAALAAAARNAA